MDIIRGIVLDALVTAESTDSRSIIRDVLNKYDYLDQRDKAFIKLLYEGTLHRLITLDFILDKKSSVKVRKMRPVIRNILRVGLYQLLFSDVPSYAVVKESVDLARKRGFKQLSGFVNGILRNISSEIDQSGNMRDDRLSLFLPEGGFKSESERMSIYYSSPEFITDLLIDEYGKRTEDILKAMEKTRRISIRFRTDLSDEEISRLVSLMTEKGVCLERDPDISFLYHADNTGDVKKLPGYDEGLFYIQDRSSIRAVLTLGIREGERILDCCAAPGGKSILASELTGKKGTVTSCDVSEKKTEIIKENVSRLRCGNVNVIVRDASVHYPEDEGRYDIVILDVPCSGLGVMGRKRDIAFNLRQEDLVSIANLQKMIIDSSVSYVRPGGKLLYSTCTIRQAENEDQVKYICDKYGFEIVKGPELLLPDEAEQDGFFYAVLEKK